MSCLRPRDRRVGRLIEELGLIAGTRAARRWTVPRYRLEEGRDGTIGVSESSSGGDGFTLRCM